MLSEKNKHPFDQRIKFKADGHKYWIDNDDTNLVSVTTFIHKFFSTFDTHTTITNILKSSKYNDPDYKYHNMSYKEIETQWEENRIKASSDGTNLHADIESFYNNLDFKNDSNEFKQFLSFREEHKDLEIFRTEWLIFADKLKITGSIDAVFKNKDDTLTLCDWKRSKEISFRPYDNKYGKYPFEHVPDCNFYHYSLQLNLYRIILEKFYNKKIKDMFLIVLHPDNKDDKYIKIKVERMEKEADLLLKFREKELSNNLLSKKQQEAYNLILKNKNI